MSYSTNIRDLDDDSDRNVKHLAEHDLTKEEVEDALADPEGRSVSRNSGLPIIFGTTSTGRFLAVASGSILRLSGKRLSVKALPVSLPISSRTVGIVTLKNRTISPVAALFADCAREVARPLLKAT